MPARIPAVIAVVAVTAIAGSDALNAQQPPFTRKLLQDQNLSVQGRHAVQVLAEFIPGGASGRHTHPGEELGYIMDGSIELQVEGQPPRTLKAGDTFFVPAGVVHDGKNVGGGSAKVFATYVVETGKPVASPAK